MDLEGWQRTFGDLAREHGVPGAAVAVLADGEIGSIATGVLHTGSGVEATPDSLFEIGSVTKVYTATLVMCLVDQGLVSLDTPVAEILPDFRVADPDVAAAVTLRHLLSHSSGLHGDFVVDTGAGDDCLERYVAACHELGQVHPLGLTMSYCNSGYIVLGRVVEQLTGTTWDAALTEHLLAPLGLTSTCTRPEDILRFRWATGHTVSDGADGPRPVDDGRSLPRSDGPAGLLSATAADVAAFARMHVDHGHAADGTPVVVATSVAEMQRPQVEVPNPHRLATHWGLGWALAEWDGHRVLAHDGDTIGQSAFLRVVPDAGVAVALVTNLDRTGAFQHRVVGELLGELAGIAPPAPPEPGPTSGAAVNADDGGDSSDDVGRYAGVYERVGSRTLASVDGDGRLHLRVTPTGAMAEILQAYDVELVPTGDGVLAGKPSISSRWISVAFVTLADGRTYLHDGVRATPRTSA